MVADEVRQVRIWQVNALEAISILTVVIADILYLLVPMLRGPGYTRQK
jgi:hypothetical protein